MDEAPLLTTQIRPSGATATDRGIEPTATSASRRLVAVSNTLTLSLSWFTTHKRVLAALRGSSAIVEEPVGRVAPKAP